jgi:hypothetical protein
MWDTNGSGPVAHFQPIDLVPTGANSPEDQTPAVVPPLGTPWGPVPPHVVVPDADGWVTVPTLTLDGVLFDLMSFNSAGVVPGGTAPVGPAGQADPTPENGRTISITFEAATVSNATPLFTNGLSTIYVDNWIEAHALDLVQFGTSACSGIGAALDIEYTVDHERMRSWSVGISSAAGAQPLSTPLPSGTGPRGSFGIVNENTSGWAKCSYTLSLTALLSMTNGTIDDSGRTYPLTFCKT